MNEEILNRIEELENWKKSLMSVDTIPYEYFEAIKARFPQLLFGKTTFDLPSVNAGASTTMTLTVYGASLGDLVVLGLPTAEMETGRFFTGYVSAQDTVTIKFDNQTAGALNLNSADYSVCVIKKGL